MSKCKVKRGRNSQIVKRSPLSTFLGQNYGCSQLNNKKLFVQTEQNINESLSTKFAIILSICTQDFNLILQWFFDNFGLQYPDPHRDEEQKAKKKGKSH